MIIVLALLVLMVIFSTIQMKSIGGDSVFFLVFLNGNIILFLLVFFLVVRNLVKLFLERKRSVLGYKLRTKLVFTFVLLSLVPTVLIFVISVNFVQNSVNYWFNAQVEEAMEEAVLLTNSFYKSEQNSLKSFGAFFINEMQEKKLQWHEPATDVFFEKKFREYNLEIIAFISKKGSIESIKSTDFGKQAIPLLESQLDWNKDVDSSNALFTKQSIIDRDLIIVILPIDKGSNGYLVLGRSIGLESFHTFNKVSYGLAEYRKMKEFQHPWQLNIYLSLGVMAGSILFGSIWFGLRLAREISSPIQALVLGTERVVKGDLEVSIVDDSDDEIGMLVQSFNGMMQELAQTRAGLELVHERLEAQNKELEKNGQYIATVLDNITSGVISLTGAGLISTINGVAERLLQLSAKQLIAKDPLVFMDEKFKNLYFDAVIQLNKNPQSVWQRQVEIFVAGRSRSFLINAISLYENSSDEKNGMVVVFEDITNLEKMQRAAAWREVAKRIAHEIKNPLTPIKLSAQRLKRKFSSTIEDASFLECTEIINSQVDRIEEMVTEFSTYAKLPEVELSVGDLGALLSDATHMFMTTHPQIDWRVNIAEKLPEVLLDEKALRRVFLNLLTNAVDALEENTLDNSYIAISADYLVAKKQVEVSIVDNGIGLSTEDAARMFEPYFSRKKMGTGLGLAIVRSILDDHKVTIDVRANKPTGLLITISFPLANN